MLKPKPVYLESPYAGDVERNVEYTKRCTQDSISRGEAPFVSHLLYTQVLDDTIPEERALGIACGNVWRCHTVVYKDYGISKGMVFGIIDAISKGYEIEYRKIGENPEPSKLFNIKYDIETVGKSLVTAQ